MLDIALRSKDRPGVCRLRLKVSGISQPSVLNAQTMEDYMEVVLARLDAIRRRGADAMPQLRETFTAAGQTLQASHTAHVCTGILMCPPAAVSDAYLAATGDIW